ncbi:ANTAR domain-containing protein [Streptomyces sp. H27-D2]|uniref:ANTAR domain-containing protein n=1 Tax=Streptomyces sp. H27-D2 TaxID=3046304 RepID=UPI002DBC9DBF|nr:ANTAR domain-containing protein [Streptomyces sp. H27-D2]MEC4017025.1 ANTAR domain-containing protein [Streptomyces sp. H27-D2]
MVISARMAVVLDALETAGRDAPAAARAPDRSGPRGLRQIPARGRPHGPRARPRREHGRDRRPGRGAVGLGQAPLAAGARALGLDGLAVSLLPDADADAATHDAAAAGRIELVAHTCARGARFVDLQSSLGAGPSEEAELRGVPVLADDLAQVPEARWPGLPTAAPELGVRAGFAFPLRIGVIRVGVLTGHRGLPGALPVQALADAHAFADRLTLLLLTPPAGDGDPDSDPDADPDADPAGWPALGPVLRRTVLHQATGMVAAQLGISPAAAMLRLRGHALCHGVALLEVARDVVHLRLRLRGGLADAGGGVCGDRDD